MIIYYLKILYPLPILIHRNFAQAISLITKKADTLRHMRGMPLQVAVINYESAWRLEKELAAWNPDLRWFYR
jgi:hypothetical protein